MEASRRSVFVLLARVPVEILDAGFQRFHMLATEEVEETADY